VVFQWHEDGFSLPEGAKRLASSTYYENQAFRLGKNIYGLQFHLEMTSAMIERWIDERSKDLAQVPYIHPDKIVADTQNYLPTLKYYAEKFLSEFIRRATKPKGLKSKRGHAKV
jgi:GMP synthase (glutamine-hydrolysing)